MDYDKSDPILAKPLRLLDTRLPWDLFRTETRRTNSFFSAASSAYPKQSTKLDQTVSLNLVVKVPSEMWSNLFDDPRGAFGPPSIPRHSNPWALDSIGQTIRPFFAINRHQIPPNRSVFFGNEKKNLPLLPCCDTILKGKKPMGCSPTATSNRHQPLQPRCWYHLEEGHRPWSSGPTSAVFLKNQNRCLFRQGYYQALRVGFPLSSWGRMVENAYFLMPLGDLGRRFGCFFLRVSSGPFERNTSNVPRGPR